MTDIKIVEVENIVNLTPHDIMVMDADGEEVGVFPKSGDVARCHSQRKFDYMISFNGKSYKKYVVKNSSAGLPDPVDGTLLLVSAMIKDMHQDRKDLVGPDSSPDGSVRNEKGHIVHVLNFA